MNLAISNIAWEIDQEDEVYTLMKKFDFRGLEVASTKIWRDPLAQIVDKINKYRYTWERERGISIVATQSILFGHPDYTLFENKKIRHQTLEYLKKMIALTSQLGAKVLVFGSPKNRSGGYKHISSQEKIAVEFFYQLAEFSKLHNIYFCIEPNASEYQCNFVVNTHEAINFIKQVNHPYFQLHLDTGVMYLNDEDYKNSLYEGFAYLKHMHISEPFLEPIGKSGIPHKLIAETLRELGYQRWVSIEMVAKNKGKNIAYVKQALEIVSSLYA